MDLTDQQMKCIGELAERSDLRLVVLFGSAAGGPSHERSDVDIAVRTREGNGLSLSRYSEVLEGLERIFPGHRLDLASLDHADPLFLKKITERCRLLAGKLSDFQRLKLLAFRRYQDHKRFLEMERRFAERFVEERAPR
jgi:predicted nucleotidyltransferase